MIQNKNNLAGLFTDALDTQEQLEEVKKDIGDCDIPKLIAQRKAELTQFTNKYERAKRELQNLKKASRGGKDGDARVANLLKEVEFKLRGVDKDRQELVRAQGKELDGIQPADCDDYGKNFDLLAGLRRHKHEIVEAEAKLKEMEELQVDIQTKMTEADIENSTDLLSLKAQDLRDRLQVSKTHLKKIQKSGEEMDGNTSTGEEEDFIQALKNEMPEVLDNIETNLGLLKDIERLVKDVKQTMSKEKMDDLREKVNIASENVEESESLVNKLEKEIIAWSSLKKLYKRDQELEEMNNMVKDFIADLTSEKENTMIELERNRDKQEENKGQDMVDKDGKKVDIMADLIRLEGQMKDYVEDIDALLDELSELEESKDKIFNEFDAAAPKIVSDERKRRQEQIASLKPSEKQLKRPPMMPLKRPKTQKGGADAEDGELDTYQLLSLNCKFRP